MTHEGLQGLISVSEMYAQIDEALGTDSSKTPRFQRINRSADYARKEIAAGFPHLHAHSLLGVWGAFECLVEDLIAAMLEAHPNVLETPGFEKVKVPASLLAVTSASDQARAIVIEAKRTLGSDLTVGTTKFEKLLGLVGLAGPVPRIIADKVFLAQGIRNVWAHRGGIADARFVMHCPQAGVDVGDRVNLTSGDFLSLMHAIHMYALGIVNRYTARFLARKVPATAECPGFEKAWDEVDFQVGAPAWIAAACLTPSSDADEGALDLN